MGESLADQLIKAGLVDKKKAESLKKARYKKRRLSNKSGHSQTQSKEVSEAEAQAKKAQAEKLVRDRELNRQRNERGEQRRIAIEINHIANKHKIDREGAEIAFNFVRNAKVRRLYVTEQQHKDIIDGRLFIVDLHGRYEVLAKRAADQVRERDPRRIVSLDEGSGDADDGALPPADDVEDPYAEYKVPDDLMW
jgi:uncharacterized protein YaiL (DUF2058 family)